MAFSATIVGEMRATTGSNDNGGFYKSDAGTTDYSQQDVAEASFTNLSTDVAGTQITDGDAGGLMTAQMVGNGFKIASAWYEIKTYIGPNDITIDRSAGSSLSGLSGKIGGAVALPTDAMWETFVGGNVLHMKSDGTYTLTENVDIAADGAFDNPIKIKGYNATRGDNPIGNNRPLIVCGAFIFAVDDYWTLTNLRVTGTSANAFLINSYGALVNCDFDNTSVTSDRYAVYLNAAVSNVPIHAIGCSMQSVNGYGVRTAYSVTLYRCAIKDSVYGIHQSNNIQANIIKCIIYRCTNTALYLTPSRVGSVVTNNTIHDCGTAINMGNSRNFFIEDNIISDCTVGMTGAVGFETAHRIDYNHLHNNGTDYVNVPAGANDTSGDPEYPDAASGDFATGAAVDTVRDFPYAESEDNYKKGAVESAGAGATSHGWG